MPTGKIKLRMKHGLGDSMQCTVILKHIKHYLPDWHITVSCIPQHRACFRNLADTLIDIEWPWTTHGFDRAEYLLWGRAERIYKNAPSTKVTRCLTEVFNWQPVPELYKYHFDLRPQYLEVAEKWLKTLPTQPKFVMHCEGNSATEQKNLPRYQIAQQCQSLVKRGITPIVLDWSKTLPFVDQKTIFAPYTLFDGVNDAEVVAALLTLADDSLLIDSGPGHVLGGLEVEGNVVWTGFHPLNCYDLCPNVNHLVYYEPPPLFGPVTEDEEAYQYFEANYKHAYYDWETFNKIFTE